MKQNRTWTKDEIEFLKQNLKKFGAIVCAEKLNRTINSIIGKGHQLHIGTNQHPTNATKEEIKNLAFNGIQDAHFDFTIDFSKSKFPKELAYFLGYFWADGYISNKGSLAINIVQEDGDKVFPIFQKLGQFNIYHQIRKGRKPQSEIQINRVDIATQLRQLGKYSKTVESHQKIIDYIPQKYWAYFLRGYIDGDGCYYIQSKKNTFSTIFSIASSYDQDWTGIQKLLEYFGLKTKVIKRQTKTGCSSYIRNCNSKEIKEFVEKFILKKIIFDFLENMKKFNFFLIYKYLIQ